MWNIMKKRIRNSILDVLEKLVETTMGLHVERELFMVCSLGHLPIKKPES